jgi:hypothetical protein
MDEVYIQIANPVQLLSGLTVRSQNMIAAADAHVIYC